MKRLLTIKQEKRNDKEKRYFPDNKSIIVASNASNASNKLLNKKLIAQEVN